jgi:transposase
LPHGLRHTAGTGSPLTYWKGAFYCLEEVMEVWLVYAAHSKAISRRKADVMDAEWIAQLRPSPGRFVVSLF